MKEYLIISGVSLVVSLYLFEGYLTFKNIQFFKGEFIGKQIEKKWDKRSKFEIYKNLKKRNDKIVVTVAPIEHFNKNYSIFPLSGISNSETIYCMEDGYYSIYQSDRYGFNNPDVEWDKEEIEYLLVGDSFTHGACVNRPNDIGSVLRTLSNKSVLNLGQSGNGPLIQYATLREYLGTNTKKVLWIYYEGNDLIDLTSEIIDNFLKNYLTDMYYTQNLKFKQNEIDDLLINFIKENEAERERKNFKLKLIYFIKIYYTRNLIFPASTSTSEFKKILQLAKELVEKNNSKLYFVYLPEYRHYKINYDKTNYNLVKNIVTELNIPFIDIHKEVFEKEKNPLKLFPFELPGHYNAEGYKKVAETIYKLN